MVLLLLLPPQWRLVVDEVEVGVGVGQDGSEYVRVTQASWQAPYDRTVVGVGDPQVLNRSSQTVPVEVQEVMEPQPAGQGGGVYVVDTVIS